jgi:putative ABC transport system permease protein
MKGIPFRYSARSILRRRTAFVMTTAGVTVVVAVFVAMLAMTRGMQSAFVDAGDANNVVVVRRGTLAESTSAVTRDAYLVMRDLPGVQAISPEAVILWTLVGTDGRQRQLPLRGITSAAWQVHRGVGVVEGRRPERGHDEIAVGKGLLGKVEGLTMGGQFRTGRREWTVVGVLGASGSAFESEIWGDVDALLADEHRVEFSSVTLRTTDGNAARDVAARIETDKRIGLHAVPEPTYYKAQAGSADAILGAALTVAVLMGIAAVFGALNTLQASLAARRREIATLRAIGFGPGAIARGLVTEALLQTLPAGVLGCLLAGTLQGHSAESMNMLTFSSVMYRFRMTTDVIIAGLVFAALIGLVGGIWPALSAGRRPIVDGLRS